MKLIVLTGDDRVELVHDVLEAGVQGSHDCTLIKGSPSWFVEVLPRGANKGEGLIRMCEDVLEIEVAQVAAFGDGNNDVEFLDVAGWGVCMKNGSEKAKAAGDTVLEWTNDEHGVAKSIEEMTVKGWF